VPVHHFFQLVRACAQAVDIKGYDLHG
jgi:hypothetical protein